MQTWALVLTRVRRGCVVHTCQNKIPRERLTSRCEWRHAPETRAEDLGDFEKVVELRTRLRTGRMDFRGSLRPSEFARYGYRTRWGLIWKSQNRNNVYLSPYVEEPLNSKVIKSFVPELRSRKCFSCFEIPMFYIYIYLYEHYMYVSHIRIMGMVHKYLINNIRSFRNFVKQLQNINRLRNDSLDGWLVGFLWHINLSRLFNAKSIFM